MLDIHLEGIDDNGERLEMIGEIRKSFIISIPPVLLLPMHEVFENGVYPSDYFYPKKIVEILKEISKRPNIIFGQQGYLPYCPECYCEFISRGGRTSGAWPDPWHENKCLYGKIKSVDEQAEIMQKGKRAIENILEVSPQVYCPPNHQYDENTKKAAEELRYKYFATRGILTLPVYREGKLVVLPERDLGQKGKIFYTHYDQMRENLGDYLELIKNSRSLDAMKVSERPKFRVKLNEYGILLRKRVRDWKNIFNE